MNLSENRAEFLSCAQCGHPTIWVHWHPDGEVKRDQGSFCFTKSLVSLLKTEGQGRRRERQERRSTPREGETTKDPVWFAVTDEGRKGEKNIFRMSFTSDAAAWRRTQRRGGGHLYVSSPPRACVSEAPMSLAGSCQYREAVSSHACLLPTKAAVPPHLFMWSTRVPYGETLGMRAGTSVTAARERGGQPSWDMWQD